MAVLGQAQLACDMMAAPNANSGCQICDRSFNSARQEASVLRSRLSVRLGSHVGSLASCCTHTHSREFSTRDLTPRYVCNWRGCESAMPSCGLASRSALVIVISY